MLARCGRPREIAGGMSPSTSTALGGGFTIVDWAVVFGVLALTTLVGALTGKRASIREFFLGGRRLPWWAVSLSIVATEISALTLVSVPYVVFKPGGNFAYLQITVIGSVLARLIVAWWLVPTWYEREIYSPYDYMGNALGPGVRAMASGLFALGGVLAQGARVFVTAVVLQVILHDELEELSARTHVPSLALAVMAIGAFAILWTYIGGIASVVWTDVILFVSFTTAAAIALWCAAHSLDKGWERLWQVGVDSHKLDFFDFDTSPAKAYTFWAAAIASSWGGIGAYGLDQMMAQRIFCCRSVRDARLAIVASSIAVLVTVLVAMIGVGLFAYYERHPLSGEALALYQANGDRILPIFVREVVPPGFKGVILAGIFAAAISTLTGILAALSQTTLSTIWLPLRARARRLGRGVAADQEEKRSVRASRAFVLFWGASLCAMAVAMEKLFMRYGSILDLGLSMAGYTQGALIAGFLLAFLKVRVDGSGFLWSAPLSVLGVFAIAWHGDRSRPVCLYAAAIFFAAWILLRAIPGFLRRGEGGGLFARTVLLAAGLALIVWINRNGEVLVATSAHADPDYALQPLAFPWYVPAGSVIAFVFGYLLARPIMLRGSTSTSDRRSLLEVFMSRTMRLRSLLALSMVSLATLGCASLPLPAARSTTRAMWVTRFDYQTKDDILRIVEACRLASVNTILFQVRGNATASYRSPYEPWSEQLNGADPGFDPLAVAVQAAHDKGIALHAWVNVMPAWGYSLQPPRDPSQIYNKHKDWLWYDQKGELQPLSEKFYVSVNPCLPEVRRYLVDVMRDIVARYSVDGLHLDYIRFPSEVPEGVQRKSGTDYPRDKQTLALFKGETGKTPEQDPKAWTEWRTAQVSNLLRDIRRMVRETRIGVELSAAVGPEPDKASVYFQDVKTWLADDLLDAVYPMNYTGDMKQFDERVAAWRTLAANTPVVMGVSLEKGDIALNRAQLEAGLRRFHGYSMFAYSSLFDSANTTIAAQDEAAQFQRQQRRKRLLPILKELSGAGGSAGD